MSRTKQALAVAATALASAALPASAMAALPQDNWGCDASALRIKLLNSTPLDPLVANPGQVPCASATEGIDNLGPQIGNILGADVVRARTIVDSTMPVKSESPSADATVANVRVTNTGTPLIELPGTIASHASVTCVGGQPKVTSSYSDVPLKIGGRTILTDHALTSTLNGLSGLLGAVLTLKPGEIVQSTSGGVTTFTIRGLHVNLHLGTGNVVDLIAAESTVSYTGNPCTNSSLPGAPSSNSGGGSNGGSGSNGSNGSNGGNTTSISPFGIGYDAHGFRIDATRTVLGGKWTRVRVSCSPKATKTCSETLIVYRLFQYVHVREIGRRKIRLRPGHWVIFSVRTQPFPRYPVYGRLV